MNSNITHPRDEGLSGETHRKKNADTGEDRFRG